MYAHYFFTFSVFLVLYAKIILPSSLSFSPKHEICYLQLKSSVTVLLFSIVPLANTLAIVAVLPSDLASFNYFNIFIHINYFTFYIPYLKFLVSLIIKT